MKQVLRCNTIGCDTVGVKRGYQMQYILVWYNGDWECKQVLRCNTMGCDTVGGGGGGG